MEAMPKQRPPSNFTKFFGNISPKEWVDEGEGSDRLGFGEVAQPSRVATATRFALSDTGVDVKKEDIEWNIAVERPLEIFVSRKPFSVTMRTPEDDEEGDLALVTGLLFTEAIYNDLDKDIDGICPCPLVPARQRIAVFLKGDAEKRYEETHGARGDLGVWMSQTSCGLCGKQSGDEILVDGLKNVNENDKDEDVKDEHTHPVERKNVQVQSETLMKLVDEFEKRQGMYQSTKTTHMSAVFSADGSFLSIAEDVGRHNALDKAIGRSIIAKTIEQAAVIISSSRISFELAQKAVRARVSVLAGISAPTSQAVELCDKYGVTLIGKLSNKGFTVFTHPEHIIQ